MVANWFTLNIQRDIILSGILKIIKANYNIAMVCLLSLFSHILPYRINLLSWTRALVCCVLVQSTPCYSTIWPKHGPSTHNSPEPFWVHWGSAATSQGLITVGGGQGATNLCHPGTVPLLVSEPGPAITRHYSPVSSCQPSPRSPPTFKSPFLPRTQFLNHTSVILNVTPVRPRVVTLPEQLFYLLCPATNHFFLWGGQGGLYHQPVDRESETVGHGRVG